MGHTMPHDTLRFAIYASAMTFSRRYCCRDAIAAAFDADIYAMPLRRRRHADRAADAADAADS